MATWERAFLVIVLKFWNSFHMEICLSSSVAVYQNWDKKMSKRKKKMKKDNEEEDNEDKEVKEGEELDL